MKISILIKHKKNPYLSANKSDSLSKLLKCLSALVPEELKLEVEPPVFSCCEAI